MLAQLVRVVGSALVLSFPLSLWPAGGTEPGSTVRSVRRTPSPDGFRIAYEWTDAEGAPRAIDLPVSRSELEASEMALGFSVAELREFLIGAEIRIREEEGLSALDIARKVVSRISDPQHCRISRDPGRDFNFVMRTNLTELPGGEAEIARVLAAYRRRWEASRKTVCTRLQAHLKEFAGVHGMEVTPNGIAVDYKKLVRTSAVQLKPIAEEFRRTFGPAKKDILEALYSFVQSIPYMQEPPVEGGRYTAGVSVPLRVLAEDQADCDSKAVLFAALWTDLCNHRTILIRVPGHMLVGIGFPSTEGVTIEIQSTRCLLLELSGPEKTRPGVISLYSAEALSSKNYKYRIVS